MSAHLTHPSRPSNSYNPTRHLPAAGHRLLSLALGLFCLTSAASRSFAAGAIAIESIAFSKNPSANNGQMFVTIRNNGPAPDTISAVTINGTAIDTVTSTTGEWYRYDRPTIAAGGVSVLTVKDTGTTGPISPGIAVTVALTAASGATASFGPTTLTHQNLRLAYIVASQDMRTLFIFVENRDTVDYTVTQVFLDNDVTANCTFLGGTTIAPGTVGIIKANMGSPVPLLTPYAVRVLANKSGGGAMETASGIRIRRPYIPLLIWAGTGENNYHVFLGQDKSWDLECLREANCDSLWMNCNRFEILASYNQRYKMGALTHINQFNQPYLDFQYSVLPNRGAPYIWGWVVDSEPELHSDRPPKAQNIWNNQYWQTNLIAGTYVDNPQQARMNEYRFVDMHGFDNYPGMSSLQTVRDYMDKVMDNCEPFTGTSHDALADPGWGTQPKDFGVNDEFWFPTFSGSKAHLWYGYRGTGASSSGGAFQNSGSLGYTGFGMMRHCNREFVQIRNLMLYSPRGLTSAAYPGGGAIAMSGGGVPAKWQAKMMVSEEAVVMGLVNWNATSSTITDQTGCSVAFTLPPWIPVEDVYEVTPTGKAACSYTVSGQRVTISGITIHDSKIYVAGKNDTTPPTAPTEVTIARQTSTVAALSWRESWDNYGVMGYRVYSNSVQVADLQCPIWTNAPIPAFGAIYTVKAYDSALNLSAASYNYEACGTNLVGRWFAGGETLADVSSFTPAGTHDGVVVGANPEALAYSDDVPPGQTGKSLDLTANGAGKQVGVAIANSSTRDAAYRSTFDDEIRYGFLVSFWYKGDFPAWEGPVSKRGVEGPGDYWAPDATTGWGIRKTDAGQLAWTIRSQQAYTNFDGKCTGGTPFDGNWHKIEAVWNGQTGVRNVTLDGTLVLNQAPPLADMFGAMQMAAPNHLGIGVREWVDAKQHYEWYPRHGTNFAYAGWFNGKIYDVRIYKQAQLTERRETGPIPLTATAHGVDKTYDGNGTAAVTFTDNRVSGDTLTYTCTASFADRNAGTGKAVSVSDIVLGGPDASKYALLNTTASTTASITPALLTVTASAQTKTYDGTTSAAAPPTITSGSIQPGDTAPTWTETYDNKNASTGKTLTPVTAAMNDGNGGANYAVTFASNTAGEITTRPITVTAATDTKQYDGTTSSAATPTITAGNIQPGDTASFGQAFATKPVGTGVTLAPSGSVTDGNGGANYAVTFANDTTGEITTKAITVTAVTATKAYDGNTSSVAVPTVSPGLGSGDTANFAETYDTKDIGTGKTLTPSGSVTDGNGGANYAVTLVNDITGVIGAKLLTVSGIEASDKVYDGTTAATLATNNAVLVGVVGAEDVALSTTNATGAFANKNVGIGKVVHVSGLALYGTDIGNYALTQPSTNASIAQLAITVTAMTDTKVYDGNTSSGGVPTVSPSVASGDTANFAQAFDTKNAGTGKTLTPSGSVSDSNGGANYSITFANNATGVITAKPVTVTAVTDTKVYDGSTGSVGVPTVSPGVAPGDTANFGQDFAAKHVGTGKALVASGSVSDGNGGANYAISFAHDTTGVINPLPITVTAVTDTKVYDGNTSSVGNPTVSPGVAGGDTANFTQAFDTKNGGTGKTLSPSGSVSDGNGGANYNVTFADDTSGVITAKAITVAAVTDTKVYDGNTSSVGNPTVSPGLASGDTAKFTQAFDTKQVGTGKTLNPSGSVSDGNGGANYAITFANDPTGVITAKPITVTAVTDTKVYDGNTSAVGIPTVSPGVTGGDTANFTQAFDTKNVGTGKTLSPSGSVSDGNGGANYNVTFANNTSAVITAKPITVTAVTDTKVYDGNTSSVGVPTVSPGVASGDTATFGQAFATKLVGTGKTLSPSGAVSDGKGGANYSVTFANDTTGVITSKPITVTAVTDSKVYDGTTGSSGVPTVSPGLAGGDTANFAQAFASKHVGTGKTLAPSGSVSDGNGGANYALTFANTTTGTITQTNITLTAATNTKPYDGTTTAAAIPSVTSGSVQTGDTANFTETYDDPNVGTGKTLTPAGAVADGNGGANYNVTFVPNTTGVITPSGSQTNALGTTVLFEGPGAGSDSVVLAVPTPATAWTATVDAAWLHLSPANQQGTGSTNVVFSYDANPGATRSGTLTLSGQTLTVTQVGSTYVMAPGPLTTLVSAGLNTPVGLAVDGAGNAYIADTYNNAIEEWAVADNALTMLVSAGLNTPLGVAVDSAGNLYIADSGNNAIQKWTATNNTLTSLVSEGLNTPSGVAVDAAGNVYIADSGNNAIKKWTVSSHTLTTLVDSGLNTPSGVAVDAAGNVYIADYGNNAIKQWTAGNNTVTTLVASELSGPWGVAVDGGGNVYIADSGNNAIKEWTVKNSTLIALVSAGLDIPSGVAVDGAGNVYVADTGNNLIAEQPRAFVDPTPRSATAGAGSGVLPAVLPATVNLRAPFEPTSDQAWLSITGITNGVVGFAFSANTGGTPREGHITLLGQLIAITQQAALTPPRLFGPTMLSNGRFQFSFSNNASSVTFTVLTTTNLSLPLSNWTSAGVATNIAPGLFHFSTPVTNNPRGYYRVRSQ